MLRLRTLARFEHQFAFNPLSHKLLWVLGTVVRRGSVVPLTTLRPTILTILTTLTTLRPLSFDYFLALPTAHCPPISP